MKKQNQEASLEYYLPLFERLDPTEVTARTNIEFDTELSCFVLHNLGHKLHATHPNFSLLPAESNNNVHAAHSAPNTPCPKTLYGFQMQILTMRVLTAGVYAPPTPTMKAYRELPWGDLYDPNFSGRCIKRFAYGFGYKSEAFEKAAPLLGGSKVGGSKPDLSSSASGDVAFDFPFLGGITCRFILWKPDDEFPPSAQILFSDNAPLIYNAEDLAVVGDIIISTLKELK